MGESTGEAVHFTGNTLDRYRHVCAFFETAVFVPPQEFLRELRDRTRD